jgi:hypothetical protein
LPPNPRPAFLRYATLDAKRGFLTQGLGGTSKTVDAVSNSLRFEPKTGWAAQPVQPPAGTWQLRAARVYRIWVANVLILFLMVFLPHRNLATWVVLWILMGSAALQTAFSFAVGAQLERRERKPRVYDMDAKVVKFKWQVRLRQISRSVSLASTGRG